MSSANPWAGEIECRINGASIRLRCRMGQFALLCAALECETLVGVQQKWDGLNPDVMKKSLEIFAENPARARLFWEQINGFDGLTILHRDFYTVSSGKTPEQLREECAARKKLEAWLMQKDEALINQVVAQLEAAGEMVP